MSMLLIANHLQTLLLFSFLRWPNTTQLCLHSFHCCVPSTLPLNIRPCLSYSPCLHCTDHPACAIHVTHSHCLHHPPHTPHPLLPSTVKADYMFGNGREKQSVSRWVAISEGLVSFWCWKVSVWISLVCSTHLYHSPCSSPCTAPH